MLQLSKKRTERLNLGYGTEVGQDLGVNGVEKKRIARIDSNLAIETKSIRAIPI